MRQMSSRAGPQLTRSVVLTRGNAALRKNCDQFAALTKKSSSPFLITQMFRVTHIEPQFAFICFFQNDAQSRREFDVGPCSAGAAIIPSDTGTSPSQLPDHSLSRRGVRQGLDKVEHGDDKSLRSVFQGFGCFIHVLGQGRTSAISSVACLLSFRTSTLHFLQSCNSAILQFLRAAE